MNVKIYRQGRVASASHSTSLLRLRRSGHRGLEVPRTLLYLSHLLCVFLGPPLGLAYLVWFACTGFARPEALPTPLTESVLFDATWKIKIWTIVAFYGSCVWILSILPIPSGLPARTAKVQSAARLRRMMWQHTVLWTVAFGPLAYLCGWYAGLRWPWWGLVLVGVACMFYDSIYKSLIWKARL